MDREVLLPIVLVISFLGTVACWVRIWRTNDHLGFKIYGVLIALVPVIGPLLYLFTCMPPRAPKDMQEHNRRWRGW